MRNRYVEFVQDVLITLHANIRDLKERRSFADPEELTHIEAKLLAYNEMLSILRASADDVGLDCKKLGL
jgi:hypothetical protein